eukprot:5645461-Pleurochrysis_carterae.AAC.3
MSEVLQQLISDHLAPAERCTNGNAVTQTPDANYINYHFPGNRTAHFYFCVVRTTLRYLHTTISGWSY